MQSQKKIFDLICEFNQEPVMRKKMPDLDYELSDMPFEKIHAFFS